VAPPLKKEDLTDALQTAVVLYRAGLITHADFKGVVGGQAEVQLAANPTGIEIPKQEGDHSSTLVSIGKTPRAQGRKKINSSDSSSHLTVLWNKLPSQVRVLLSVVPDLSYAALLTTALLTENEIVFKTAMAYTVPYAAYFIINIPTRIRGCFRAVMWCLKPCGAVPMLA
jgi:hypothetical protein